MDRVLRRRSLANAYLCGRLEYHEISACHVRLALLVRAIMRDDMQFDFDEWQAAIFGMAQGMINMNDLLEATGLIDSDLDEETFDRLMQSIEDDLDAAARRSNMGDRTSK